MDLFKYLILIVLLNIGYAQAYVFENFDQEKIDPVFSFQDSSWQVEEQNDNHFLKNVKSGELQIKLDLKEEHSFSFNYSMRMNAYIEFDGKSIRLDPYLDLFTHTLSKGKHLLQIRADLKYTRFWIDNFICSPVSCPELSFEQKSLFLSKTITITNNPQNKIYYYYKPILCHDTLTSKLYNGPFDIDKSTQLYYYSMKDNMYSAVKTTHISEPESNAGKMGGYFNPLKFHGALSWLEVYTLAKKLAVHYQTDYKKNNATEFYLGRTIAFYDFGCSYKPKMNKQVRDFSIYGGLGIGQLLELQLGHSFNDQTIFRINSSIPSDYKMLKINLPFVLALDGKFEYIDNNTYNYGIGLGFVFDVKYGGK